MLAWTHPSSWARPSPPQRSHSSGQVRATPVHQEIAQRYCSTMSASLVSKHPLQYIYSCTLLLTVLYTINRHGDFQQIWAGYRMQLLCTGEQELINMAANALQLMGYPPLKLAYFGNQNLWDPLSRLSWWPWSSHLGPFWVLFFIRMWVGYIINIV